ncbi:MAG: FprA family A-type flavoprotein, partial [Cyanobacteria bacterium J06641_5]
MPIVSYQIPTRTIDLQAFPVAEETLLLRSRVWERQKFEIEYALQRGSTENAYIIRTEQTTLIDLPGEAFTDIFLRSLQERDIEPDRIILSYIDPDRVATLQVLLEKFSQVQVVCSNPAAISLKKLLPEEQLENLQIAKGEEKLVIGSDRTLEIIATPTPRWPDSLCFYDSKTKILFSSKYFSAHVCGDQVFDEGWQVYLEDRRYYFDCIMAPHANQVATGLERLAQKPATLYATGHGPLVLHGRVELTNSYNHWLEKQLSKENSVALIYASAYGNTAAIAQAIARGITKAGVAVESINCEFAQPEEIKTAVENSVGFIMGSPTLGGHTPTQIQTAIGVVLSTAEKTQLAGVFGSSQNFSVSSVGLNFTRIGSKPKRYPASRNFPSRMSTASPLQPKEPNTPANWVFSAVERT